jgi:hypothetical protein
MNEQRARQTRWQYAGATPPERCAEHPEKRSYRTRGDAKRALRHIQSHHGGVNIKAVYRCSCGAFHLTHYRETWTPAGAVA